MMLIKMMSIIKLQWKRFILLKTFKEGSYYFIEILEKSYFKFFVIYKELQPENEINKV